MTAPVTVSMTSTLPDLARALASTRVAALESRVREAPPDERQRLAVLAGLELAELADIAAAWHCPSAVDVQTAVARLAAAAHEGEAPCPSCLDSEWLWVDRATGAASPGHGGEVPAGVLLVPCGCGLGEAPGPAYDVRATEGLLTRVDALLAGPAEPDDPDCVDCEAGLPVDPALDSDRLGQPDQED